VKAAARAFEEGPWGRMHHEERAKVMFRIYVLLGTRMPSVLVETEFARDIA
jgi:aldehyde dehydrogenase (NAD+)